MQFKSSGREGTGLRKIVTLKKQTTSALLLAIRNMICTLNRFDEPSTTIILAKGEILRRIVYSTRVLPLMLKAEDVYVN
jgi:hypothetical protein